MNGHLARCAEQLRYAVRHIASSPRTLQQRLSDMYIETKFGNISEDDLVYGTLKQDYRKIRSALDNESRTAALTDEQAEKLILKICSLCESISYLLGKHSLFVGTDKTAGTDKPAV
jgi:hypothetical protein